MVLALGIEHTTRALNAQRHRKNLSRLRQS
ncbi:hypothetical protein [Clostridium sp.]